jgi:hypothetical protein
MRPDDLIIRLNRLGYRTQVIGDHIVILFRGGSSLNGTRAQIEKLLPQLSKDAGKSRPISTLSFGKQAGSKLSAERASTSIPTIPSRVVGKNPSVSQPNKPEEGPTYAELLAKLKRLERDARFRLENKGERGNKKKKKKKKKKNRNDAYDWGPDRWRTVSGGLPSLGKRR